MSGDGQLLATSGWHGPVNVWDVSTGEHRFAVPVGSTADEWLSGVEWSGDGELLAIGPAGGDRSSVVVVDRTGAEVASSPKNLVTTLIG